MHTFLIRWYNNIMHIFLIKWSSNIMHIFLIKWSRNLMHTFLMKAESSETWRNLVHQRTPATGKGEFGVRSSHASPSSPTPVYVPFLPCESFTTDPSVCTVLPMWVLHHRPQCMYRSSHVSPSPPTPVYVPFLPRESFTTDPREPV